MSTTITLAGLSFEVFDMDRDRLDKPIVAPHPGAARELFPDLPV